ncbi:hypothetical protein HHI36_006007 [Cryptolaemus montrouzieri]|uniref:Uncharacterized protein n=1 Tax=Cryptolaemus montrouzieri TaxID=559131 RepID=A0ABD2NVR5_9CUCU
MAPGTVTDLSHVSYLCEYCGKNAITKIIKCANWLLSHHKRCAEKKDAEFSDCGSKIFFCNDNDNDDDLFTDSIPFTAEAFAKLKTEGIVNKTNILEAFLVDKVPDVLCITEHFLNAKFIDDFVLMDGRQQPCLGEKVDKEVIIDLLNSKLTDLKSLSKIDCDKKEDNGVINNRKNKNKRSTTAEDAFETSSPTPSASTQQRAQATTQGENYVKIAGKSTFRNSNDKGSPVLPINTTEPTNTDIDGKISTNNIIMTQSIDNSTNNEWIEKKKRKNKNRWCLTGTSKTNYILLRQVAERFLGHEIFQAQHDKVDTQLKNLKTSKEFSLLHLNVQGIVNKTNILEAFLVDKVPDVLCITEHFLNAKFIDDFVLMDGRQQPCLGEKVVINNRKNKKKRSTTAEDAFDNSSPTPSASTQQRAQATTQGENYVKFAGKSTFSNSNDKGSPVLPINTTEPTNSDIDEKISINNIIMTQSIDNSTNNEWIEKKKRKNKNR